MCSKQCLLPSSSLNSQTKPTHFCYLYQMVLFSAFQCILSCLRLFRGFSPCFFFNYYYIFSSSFPWFSLGVPSRFFVLAFWLWVLGSFLCVEGSMAPHLSPSPERGQVFLGSQLLFPLLPALRSIDITKRCPQKNRR